MKINWKSYEFWFLMGIVFGVITSLSNSSGFANFPNNMTQVSWLGLALTIVGLYGVYKAES